VALPAVRGLIRLGRAAEASPLARRQAELAEDWRCPRAGALGELALGLAEPDRKQATKHFRAAADQAAGDAPSFASKL
jgi:hypothetical protein